MKKTHWTKEEVSKLISLFKNKNNVPEISKALGRTELSVSHKLLRLGHRRENGAFQEIYSMDFCSTVYDFYKIFGPKEASEKFKITRRQVEYIVRRFKKAKGLPNTLVGDRYCDWSTDIVLIMLSYIGLKPLSFIADKIGRSESAISSYVKRRGFRLNYVNGLPKERFDELFKPTKPIISIRTLEGKVIIPWTQLKENIEDLGIEDYAHIRAITAMGNLQKFIHQKKTNQETLDELWAKIEE